MGVLLQAFYWHCFQNEGLDGAWWPRVQAEVEGLARAGFTGLWLPPAHKGGHVYDAPSMGYDPYDFYDFGEYHQRGRTSTCFGTRETLQSLIDSAHAAGLQVLADVVFNHCNGGDPEPNPRVGHDTYTCFRPASGKFLRDRECFHPCAWETTDGITFENMPDLCHRNPQVEREILTLCRFLVEEMGFDGFRYDMVKGYGSWMVAAIQEQRYVRKGEDYRPFGVGEEWSSERQIENWLGEVNAWSDNPVSAFDFPLRTLLKEMCDSYGFSMRRLVSPDTVSAQQPFRAVTFVDNHDFRGPTENGDPILHDKLMAYAYILTHEGLPCVFWPDYFNYGLAKNGTPNGIEALVRAHEWYAGGASRVLWADDDFYVMQRDGFQANPGLVVAINNRGDGWRGEWVDSRWRGTTLRPVAWWSGRELARPMNQPVSENGRAQIWAPPRGYAVYTI